MLLYTITLITGFYLCYLHSYYTSNLFQIGLILGKIHGTLWRARRQTKSQITWPPPPPPKKFTPSAGGYIMPPASVIITDADRAFIEAPISNRKLIKPKRARIKQFKAKRLFAPTSGPLMDRHIDFNEHEEYDIDKIEGDYIYLKCKSLADMSYQFNLTDVDLQY